MAKSANGAGMSVAIDRKFHRNIFPYMTALDIEKMPVREKLATMERLWAALSEESDGISSPVWHRPVLDERRRKMAAGKSKLLSLAEVKRRLGR